MSNNSFIITRAPMRVTLGGGGTDVLWYSRLKGGAWISAAIDKYVYVTLSHSENPEEFRIVLPDEILTADSIDGIENQVVRTCFEVSGIKRGVEIYVKSDASGRSGLGGSGALEVALLNALLNLGIRPVSKFRLGQLAASVEIEKLRMPVGPQDQMISALGGIQYFEMDKSGNIKATPLNISEETVANLEENLLYFRTGIQRDTAAVLGDQKQKTEKEESKAEMISALDDIKELGGMVKTFLEQGKPDDFGQTLHEHWLIKKKLSNKVSNGQIDQWYEAAMNAGALGGKIMGAGGGGWFMFYVNKNKDKFRDSMRKMGLMEQQVVFDWEGAKNMSQQEEKKVSTYSFTKDYFNQTAKAVERINKQDVAKMTDELIALKKRKGRLFILGIGGSAGNAGHAVNDFRKICGIETYAPTDNVSELTARANDESWEVIFSNWLRGSQLKKDDAIMVFSVGGGNLEKNVSPNIVRALEYGQEVGCTILGIVSRDGGYTKKVATACVLVPVITDEMITPIAESFQAVVWHGMINHPDMKASSY